MDFSNRQTGGARDVMYCHQCENEWYRDEHGISCPECHSDFCELIEDGNDPRADDADVADDPAEGDIDDLHHTGFHATFNRTDSSRNDPSQNAQGFGGGFTGLIGSVIGGLLGTNQQPPQREQEHGFDWDQARAEDEPGSPRSNEQEQHSGGTRVRHFHGPGFHMTFATSSNSSPNLFPRNPNQAQPFQGQPDHLESMVQQMFMNIGGGRGHMGGQGVMFGGGPAEMRGGGVAIGPGGVMPFGNIFQLLGMGQGGVHGDMVFSQEALDRVITQLMEQHQAGNAPGPATDEAINNLPRRTITKADADEDGKAECSICMDDVEIGGTVTELPCHHWFHHECIKAWLGEHDTCPHCRQGIMPKDDANNNALPRQPDQVPLHNTHSAQYSQMPGSFPFGSSFASPSTSGPPSGSHANDISGSRRNSNGGRRRESASNMFSRMRDAFGSSRQSNPVPDDNTARRNSRSNDGSGRDGGGSGFA